jgi:sorting and assembly machinery component 37
MVFELHVWGPAFGLPSIDAQCLAIIAYFIQCLPAADWVLIPSDGSEVPTSKQSLQNLQSLKLNSPRQMSCPP